MAKDVTKIKQAVLDYRANDKEYQEIKRKASNSYQTAPKATENTTTKGVADTTATPTSDASKVSESAKSLSKAIPVIDKVKSVVKNNMPSLPSIVTGGNAKADSFGNLVRAAFDSKNISKANQEIPVLKNDTELINYYENLPKTNALQRLTSFEKNNAYNQKQALVNQYQEAKDKTIPSLLKSKNIDTEKIQKQARLANAADTASVFGTSGGTAISGASTYGIEKYLKKNGLSDEDAKYVADYLKRNASNQTNEKIVNATGKNFGTKALGTIASVPVKGISSVSDVLNKGADYLVGNPLTKDSTQASRLYNTSLNMRNEASKDLGEFGQTMYGLGTSLGDMAFAMMLGQVTGLGSDLSAVIQGSDKAANVMNEAIERGLTPDETVKLGVSSGITTGLTSKLSMNKLESFAKAGFKSKTFAGKIGELAGKMAASFLPEASQEALENVADAFADAMIAGDNSIFNKNVEAYMNQGLSHDEAEAQALVDYGKEVWRDFWTGGVMGSIVGGGNAVINGWNIDANNNINPTNGNNDTNGKSNNAESVLATDEEVENIANEIFGIKTEPQTETNAEVTTPTQTNELVPIDNNRNLNLQIFADPLVEQFEQARQQLVEETKSDDSLTSLTAMNELNNLDSQMEQVYPELYENGQYIGKNELANRMNQTSQVNIPDVKPEDVKTSPVSKFKPSQTVTNSIMENPVFKANEEFIKEVKAGVDKGEYDVPVQTEEWQNQEAARNLEKDYDGVVRSIIAAKGDMDGVKVKEGMMILEDLAAEGKETGDYTKAKKWIRHLANKSNDVAHALQAYAQYTRTASSALIKAELMAETKAKHSKDKFKGEAKKAVKNIKSNVKGTSVKASKEATATVDNLNKRLAHIIDNIGKKPTSKVKESKSFETLRQEVVDTMKAKLPDVAQGMSDKEIDLLTTFLADNTGVANNNTIQDELEHLINHGSFYDLYENVKASKNSRISTALKNIGNKKIETESAPEKPFDTVRKEVYNTLQDELANFPQMTDLQLDFITKLAMDKTVPSWVLTDELEHFEKHGVFYNLDNSTQERVVKNARLTNILKGIGADKSVRKTATEKTFNEVRNEVVNTLSEEMGSTFDNMTDGEIDFITTLVMDKSVKSDIIADEIEHYLKHGKFFTIDESIPEKKATNSKLNSILNSYWKDGSVTTDPQAEKSFNMVREEVINSFANEPTSVFADMSDNGIDFITTLLMDKSISRDTIAKELDSYAKTGQFFTIDESIEPKQASNTRLDNIVRALNDDGSLVKEPTQKSFDEIRAEVVKSIQNEQSNLFKNFDDAKIDYITNMILHGDSNAAIENAILRNFQTGSFEISDEDIEAINQLYEAINKNPNPNSKEAFELEGQAFDILAKYLGKGTFMEQWNAWRYLGMLGNFRTHFRNMGGNRMFGAVTNIKDNIAAAMESAFNIDDRTKAVISRFNPNDKALLDFGKQDFDTSVYALAAGNKWDMQRGIKQHQKVFNDKNILGKLANRGSELTSRLLTMEDTNAMQRKYARALAGYLKANGYDTEIFSSRNEEDAKFLDKARAYALKEAEIATFHEDNKLADILTQFSKTTAESDNAAVKALNFMLESVMPFKKTPINILKQGAWDYNPVVDAVKVIGKLTDNAAKSSRGVDTKFNPNEIINDAAKGMTGSAIMAFGMLLAKKGFLKGSRTDDADDILGEQAYSIKIGNKSFTVDWTAPASLPLFVGVELYNYFANKDEFSLLDALGNLSQPIIETSMLQGFRDLIKNVAYADESSTLPVIGASMATNYLSQAIPTLGGQIARTIDPTRRNSYITGQPSGTLTDTLIRSGEKAMNKIPGLSYLSEPYLDKITGEELKNEDAGLGFFGRALQNLVLPGYVSSISDDPMKQELARLEKIASKDDSIPSVIPDSAKKSVDGEYLSPKEYTKAQKTKGDITTKNLNELLNTDAYKNATDAQKAKLIKAINGYNNQLFYKEMYDKSIDSSTYKKYDDIYKQGGMSGLAEYLNTENAYHEATDALGLEGGSLVKDIFASEGEAGLQKYKEALNKAATMYGADDITTTEWKDYNNGFMDDFNDSVKYRTLLENNDLKNTELNRNYVKEYGESIIPVLQDAEEAITQIQKGVDKYNDAEYFSPNKTMVDVYMDKGKNGVELYADLYTRDDIDDDPNTRHLTDTIPYLYSMNGLSNAEKGYYLSKFVQRKEGNTVDKFLDKNDYAGLYNYYINKKNYAEAIRKYANH